MQIKKYISLNRLNIFLNHLKNIFSLKEHTHTLSEIENLFIDNEVTASENLVRNNAVNSAIESVRSDLNNGVEFAINYADTKIANLVNSAPETLDTLGELATALQENEEVVQVLNDAISTKANADIVLYKTPQELTIEEVNQVRQNIHSVGQYATGLTYTPYEVVETGLNTSNHTITETPLDPIVAGDGAEIYNDYESNIATGLYAIATGYRTQATGNYARSNGWWTKADGQCSNAEGLLSVASGHFSHAEGTRTKATTNNAHSEGDMTVASGRQSHAEGSETVASGFCAHSEGSKTKATNYYSHAEGYYTIAAGRNQTAMGKFNASDTSSLLIVGNGTSDTERKNAFKLSSGGDGYFAGDVYVLNATDTSASSKLATEEYVDAKMSTIEEVSSDEIKALFNVNA